MRAIISIVLVLMATWQLRGQAFIFNYEGPDTLYVNENCEVPLDWGHPVQPTVTSAIGASIDSFYIYSISDDLLLNELIGTGLEVIVTYKAVDDQGNEDLFSFSLHTIDTIPPDLLSGPQDIEIPCDETNIETQLQAWFDSAGGLQAEDNCAVLIDTDISWEETLIAFNQSVNNLCGNTKEVEVGFFITDEQGNSLPVEYAVFSTFDDQDPVFTQLPTPFDTVCMAEIDILLEEWIDNVGGALASDNCSDELVWRFLWSDNAGDSGFETIGNKPYQLQVNTDLCTYTVNINFFAEDLCGNQEAAFTTITIIDDNTPYFDQFPQDTLVNCHDIPDVPDLVAWDDCKGELIVLYEFISSQNTDPLATGYYNYTIDQIWSASDGCGHDIEYIRTVTVQDTTPPDFDIPDDITVSCTEWEDLEITGEPQNITDLCCDELDVEFSDRIEGTGCSYTVFRDWTVTDISGNGRTRTQTIQVIDENVPNVSVLPQNQTTQCDGDENPEFLFNEWLESLGYSQFEDDCGQADGFAALPGSYSVDDPESFPGTYPGTDFLLVCTGAEPQLMYQQSVDFVFFDECGNSMFFNVNSRYSMIRVQFF